ncbi:MAG: hypothetical protein GQ562_03620, partial [Anaerolineales bacterium]|nr:hypothetical protein [Anaerolineales bacterium]
MRNLYKIIVLLMLVTLPLAACSPAPDAAPAEEVVDEGVSDAAPADEAADDEVTDAVPAEDAADEEAAAPETEGGFAWDQDYISEVPPIMMMDPYFGIFGQSQVPVPYYYEDAVKLSGHSCGATSGAWTIARKALEVLYPNGEIPVRGQIAVEA